MGVYNSPTAGGRPVGSTKVLTKKAADLMVVGFERTLSLRHAALHAGETPYHLRTWITQGQEDAESGKDTLCAQLFFSVGKKLSGKAAHYLERIADCPKNFQALIWIMETGYGLRSEYGKDSDLIQELIDNIKLLQHPSHKAGGANGNTDSSQKEEDTQK
jgi:hypothetical protein